VHIDYPAFLGVELSPNSQGATIADGSAAGKPGLQARSPSWGTCSLTVALHVATSPGRTPEVA